MEHLVVLSLTVLIAGILAYREAKRRNGLRIFMYHHIGEADENPAEQFFVSNDLFAQQLDYLLSNGYHPVSLSEVENALLNKAKLPKRAVLLTFDDGYRNNYDYAYPRALKRDVPFTIFVSTGEIGVKSEMLTWAQVREMQASGLVDFASHGVNHQRLRRLTDSEALAELTESKARLEQELGRETRSFCYPYGSFDKRVRKLVFDAGYALDFGTRKGINRLPWRGKRPLLRAHVMRGETLKNFKNQLKWGRKTLFS